MGKLKTNVAFKSFSNKIDGLVYYDREGDPCVRMPGRRVDPNTPKQKRVRQAMRRNINVWKQLDPIIIEAWKSHGKRRRLSNFARFVEENGARQRLGEVLNLCLEYGMETFLTFAARTGNAAGEIVCEFAIGEMEEKPFVTFFAQKRERGIGVGALIRFEAGDNAASPYTLTGLDAGGEYFIYAILADAPLAEATVVSATAGAIVVAGS